MKQWVNPKIIGNYERNSLLFFTCITINFQLNMYIGFVETMINFLQNKKKEGIYFGTEDKKWCRTRIECHYTLDVNILVLDITVSNFRLFVHIPLHEHHPLYLSRIKQSIKSTFFQVDGLLIISNDVLFSSTKRKAISIAREIVKLLLNKYILKIKNTYLNHAAIFFWTNAKMSEKKVKRNPKSDIVLEIT